MTQEEWDACTDEKRILHLFLSSQSEISGRSGKNMREAILELVADMPEELRVLPVKGFLSSSEALNCARGLVRVGPVVGPLSEPPRSDKPDCSSALSPAGDAQASKDHL